MNIIKAIIIATIVLLVTSCASTYKAKVGFDKNANVDTLNYKTFAWLTPEKIMAPVEDFNPVVKYRVDEEIEQAFIAKGYTLVTDAEKADFTISYTVGNRDKIQVSNYPTSYNTHFRWGWGYYGSMFGVNMMPETRVRQYTEGKLAIDVYDVKLRQPSWHGWATKRITSNDKDGTSGVIKNVVKEVVAQFN
jgi:hypothetical protein